MDGQMNGWINKEWMNGETETERWERERGGENGYQGNQVDISVSPPFGENEIVEEDVNLSAKRNTNKTRNKSKETTEAKESLETMLHLEGVG